MTWRAAGRRYRAVLQGRFLAVLAASVVGRLHESMVSFGVILLVTQTDSYARAGVVMAAFGAGCIVAAPVTGRLVDRMGHAPVLLTTAVLFGGGMVAMGAAVDHAALPVVAALAGIVSPPLTPAVRAWLPRLVPAEHRLTAYALESTLQEVIFVAGPVLAGGVAAWLGAQAALVAAGVATFAGTAACCVLVRGDALASRGGRDRTVEGAADGAPDAPDTAGGVAAAGGAGARGLLTPTVLRLLGGGVGFLLLLSVAAVALVAEVSGPRAQGSAGLFLGLTSVGSMVGGLVFAARVTPDAPLPPRYLVLGGSLVALAAAAALPDDAAWSRTLLALAAFGYGTAIAPVGTVLFARLSEAAGDARATEAFGWMGAAMGVGAVIGDASGGWLVTVAPSWLTLLLAAAVGAATAAVVGPRARSAGARETGLRTRRPRVDASTSSS